MPPQLQDTSTGFPQLVNFRKKYPQYGDLDDQTVIDKLAKKYPQAYGDLPGKYSDFLKTKPKETVDTTKIEQPVIDQTQSLEEVKRTPKIIEPHREPQTNVLSSLLNRPQQQQQEDEFARFRTIRLPGGDIVLPDKSKTPQLVNAQGQFDPRATEMMKEQIASQKPKDYFQLKDFQKDLDRIEYLDQKYGEGKQVSFEEMQKDERELQKLINKRNTSVGIHTGLTYGELQDAKLFRAHQKIQELKGKTDYQKDLSNIPQHVYKGVLDAINITVGSDYEPIAKSDIRKDLTNLTIDETFKKETAPKTLFGSTVQGLTTTAALAPLFAFGFTAGGVKQGAGYLANLLAATKGSLITFAPGGASRGINESIKEVRRREANGEQLDAIDRAWLFTKNIGGETLKNTMEGVSEMMIPGFKPGKTFLTNVLKKSTLGIATETATEQISDITGDLVDGTNTSLLVSFARDGKFSEEAIHQFLTEAIIAALYGSTVGGGEFWFGHLENQLPPEQFEKLKGYVDKNKDQLEKNLGKVVKKVNDDAGKLFDQYVRDLQSPEKIKTQPKDYFKITEQDQGLFPPTKDFEDKQLTIEPGGLDLGQLTDLTPEERQRNGLPQTESFDKDFELINSVANKRANGQTGFTTEEQIIQRVYPAQVDDLTKQITQSPEFRQKQSLLRQQEKQLRKKETDRFSELTMLTKNHQRKKVLTDTEGLKREIDQITFPEIKQKLVNLLNDAEKYNQKLIERNKLTIENLAKKKYGKIPNELSEEQQISLLNEYNEMKKQGINEFRNIQPIKLIKPIIKPIKEEDYAIQERITEEILQRKPEEIRGGGGERGRVEPSLEGDEITEAEEEGFIKKPSEEETRIVGKFYRGGGEGSMPRGKTAQDIINYENEELMNNVQPEPGIDLSKIPSERLVWLTETEADALEYGEAEEYDVGDNYRIIARDKEGGVLVEKDYTAEKKKHPHEMTKGEGSQSTQSQSKPGDDLEVETEPSEAQIEAGNYKKGHIKREGLDITLENLKGSTRSGTDRSGKKWEVEMKNDYGYIRGMVGKDKDHLDVFLANDYKEDSPVFIVNQTTPGGWFDEHKVMLGFKSREEAEDAYRSNYNEDAIHYRDIVEMPIEVFKEWGKDRKGTQKPAHISTVALYYLEQIPAEEAIAIKSEYRKERDEIISRKYKEAKRLKESKSLDERYLQKIKGMVSRKAVRKKLSAEELLELPETQRRLADISGEDDIEYHANKFLAKTKNYKPNKYYHATGGLGEEGLGKGLYLGKDAEALNNFYNIDGGDIIEYQGEPNFLDLTDYQALEDFEKQAKSQNKSLKQLTLENGYDGIRYYDPQATGEEFVLYNTDKIKKTGEIKQEAGGTREIPSKKELKAQKGEETGKQIFAFKTDAGAIKQLKTLDFKKSVIDKKFYIDRIEDYHAGQILTKELFGKSKFALTESEYNRLAAYVGKTYDLKFNLIKREEAKRQPFDYIPSEYEKVSNDYYVKTIEGDHLVKGSAVSLEYEGDFFAHKSIDDENKWVISEGITGYRLSYGATKGEAINNANKIMEKAGVEKFAKHLQDAIEKRGITPRYKLKGPKASADNNRASIKRMKGQGKSTKEISIALNLSEEEVDKIYGEILADDYVTTEEIKEQSQKEALAEAEAEAETPGMATDAKGYPIAIDEWGNEHTIKLWGTHIVKTGPDTIGGTGWEWYGFKKSGDIWEGFVHGVEDEFGSFSESELRKNQVTISTDPKDLMEIMPPVGWKWKPAAQKPKSKIKKQNLVSGKEEDLDPDKIDNIARLGRFAYDSKDFNEFFSLLNEYDKKALVESGLVRETKSGYNMGDFVFFFNRNKNPKTPEASETKSVIDDEMKDIIRDIEKGLEGISFQLKKPKRDIGFKAVTRRSSFQLKPGKKKAETFFSKMENVLNEKLPKSFPKKTLEDLTKIERKHITKPDGTKEIQESNPHGIKVSEIEWSGIREWIKDRGDKITKDELNKFLTLNKLKIEEKTPGGMSAPAKYGGWKTGGGENYREILFILPTKINEEKTRGYVPPHWDNTPNILAHARVSDMTIDNKKILFIDEIQSDWAREGRKKGFGKNELIIDELKQLGYTVRKIKSTLGTDAYFPEQPENVIDRRFSSVIGYDTEAEAWDYIKDFTNKSSGSVPDMPFKTDWHEFVLKRLLREAADGGYDGIAWTTGKTQKDRYNLAKYINELRYGKNKDNTYWLNSPGGEGIDFPKVREDELERYVGKELAQKIIDGVGETRDDGQKEWEAHGIIEQEDGTRIRIELTPESMFVTNADEAQGFGDEYTIDYLKQMPIDSPIYIGVDYKVTRLDNGSYAIRKQNTFLDTYDNPESVLNYFAGELGIPIPDRWIQPKELPTTQYKVISGLDLEVGGDWAINLYDKVIPGFLNKYAKKWGAHTEQIPFVPTKTLSYEEITDGIYVIFQDHTELGKIYKDQLKSEDPTPEEIYEFAREWFETEEKTPVMVPFLPVTKGMKEDVLFKGQPLFQLKPGEKIPADIQTKANDLVGRFVDKGVTKFEPIVNVVRETFGDQTLKRIFPALKAGYTAYLTNAPDEVVAKMDSFDYVRKYVLMSGAEGKESGSTLVNRKYIQRIREEIRSGNQLTKTQLEKIAKEFGITDQNVAKEQAELAIVAEARKIINENVDEKEAYDKLVEMYGNQPNLTHRTNETVDKQQYSTPAPIAYMAGLYVSDSVNAGDVLEPSAGNGMLTIAFNTNQVYVNEIDEVRLANLRQTGYQDISTKDAEKNDNLFNIKFDGIMTNPPFGNTEEKIFDGYKLNKLEHIMAANALKQMKDDGRAGIIIGGHNRYDNKGRLQNDRLFFNWLYHHYNVEDVINISGDFFKKQGAQFPTRLILVNGKKATPKGASPLYNETADAPVNDFESLYDRIERIRNGNLLRPQDNADRGHGAVADLQDTERAGGQEQSTTKTLSSVKDSGLNTGKSTKSGTTGKVSVRPSGTRESIPGDTGRVSGSDTGQSTLSGDTTQRGERGGGKKIVEGGAGGDIQGGFDREPSPIVTREVLESDKANLPYKPQSQGVSLDTVIPRNMAYDTANQLRKLADDVGGDIDAFVAEKLEYEDKEELYAHLGAEQIDAVALAIVSIEKGQGMIVGDMTGVGKGRIAASIIRYGVLNGYEPIFFTEKADLYSDLYRDLGDIGSKELLPFIVNEKTNIVDEEGKILHSTPPESKKREIIQSRDLGKYDFVCCTYSQVNSEQRGSKRGFISDLSENNIIIMDESHNASGQSNVGEYFKAIIRKSKGVAYLSATFAKRPDNMPIYALKTAINEANLTEEQLINAIERGGVALQEILSTDMVEAGQMIRRERTYEGIKVTYKPLEEKKQEHTKIVDGVTEVIRDIIAFQANHVSDIVASMDSEAAASGEMVAIETGTNMAGVDNTPFASKVFNIVDQLLFSLKADSAADEAIEAFKRGQKPVIAVKNTMESFLDYLGVNEGEVMENMDFGAVLERGLLGVMKYREKDAMGNTTSGELTVNDLSEEGRKEYRRIMNKINNTTTGISISPIDQIIYRLNKAGYKVGEVTGRDIQLKIRDDGKAIVEKRTEKDKKKLFRDFNNWEDPGTPRGIEGYKDMTLIINASGSTGRSAHSSPKFKDQRQRMMITVQIELNINTEIQKRGRINRTGQVNKPEYITLSSAIPAEQRLLMMAKKKLKSLDANVSSDQSQAGSTFEANDFLNKYGDEIVIEYLKENRELNDMLLDPLKMNIMKEDELEKFTKKENAAHKTSGRVAFLPTKLQEEFYREIGLRYDDKIAYLTSIGENDLEVQTLPLDAVTTGSRMIIAGKGGYSPFGRDTMLETVEINVLRKPLKKEEIDEVLENYLDGSTPENKKKALQQEFRTFWKDWTKEHLDRKKEVIAKRLEISIDLVNKYASGEINKEQFMKLSPHLAVKHEGLVDIEFTSYTKLADKMFNQGNYVENNILGRYNVGRVYKVPLIRDTVAPTYSNGIFLGWTINTKRRNPYAPSAIMLKFAVGDSRRIVTPPGSERDWLNDLSSESSTLTAWQEKDIKEDWDNLIPNSRREVSHIVTGNILQAMGGDVKGQLISYTTKAGELKRGILVKETKGIKENEVRVPIKRARKYIHALAVGDFIETASGDVVISNDRNGWTIEVPAAKQKGGKYYLDDKIKEVVKDGRFDKSGNVMRAYFKESNLDKLIDILQDDFGQSVRLSQDQIKKIGDADASYQLKGGKTLKDDFGNDIPVHFNRIHDYKSKHPLLKDVKVEIIPSKIVYWTREEIKEYGYTDGFINTLPKLEKGDYGYESGKEKFAIEITGTTTPDTKGSGARITISSTATSSAYAEEIIHAIQRKIEQVSPEVAQQIREWEQDVRDLAEEAGVEIPQGYETFAQAMVFTHMGYASENPDVAEIYEVPQSIYDEVVKILDMGEISSDVLRGNDQRLSTKITEASLERFRNKRAGRSQIPLIDSKLIKAQELYDKLKSEKGKDADVYLDWVRGMRESYGREFDREARMTWRQMKGSSFQLKPASAELINKVRSKGLEIDKNLIATHKIKGEEKEYITVSTPDRAITKMIDVANLEEGLRLFSNKKSDLLTPKEILANTQGRFPTPTAVREAKEILGDDFLSEYYKFREKRKVGNKYEDIDLIQEEAYLIEDFSRRTVAANKMGVKDINSDLWGKANKDQAEAAYQLKSPKKTKEQRIHGTKLENELARERGEDPQTGEGNIVDFGSGLGNVFTATADKINDFAKNYQLEKHYNLGSGEARKIYRELLTAPQWFFDKEPQLKRIWDIIDRYFVRNVNEETAILIEDKWKNSKPWRGLTEGQKKEFLSALKEYEQMQYELQRDEGTTELLTWGDFADEFALTPEVAEFLFGVYKPMVETALDMVKDVDRYKVVNETETNPYLEHYFEAKAKRTKPEVLEKELEKVKEEFFEDSPNAEALYQNELLKMKNKDEVKALQLAWINNPGLREVIADVLVDKKYEPIDGKFYFPSSRLKRKYYLSAIKKTTKEEKLLEGKFDDKFFTTSNSLSELEKIKTDLEAKGYEVKPPGKFEEAQEVILQNAITEGDMLDLAISAGVEQDNPTLERLVKAIQAKGFSRHFIPKRFIPGYEYTGENFEKSIYLYMGSVPFYKNRTVGGKELSKIVAHLKKTGVLKPGSANEQYIQDLKTKVENRDIGLSNALRAVASTYYLALSPAYLSQQIVQPLNTLLPYLPIVAKDLGLKTSEAEKAFGESLYSSIQYWAWKILDKYNRLRGKQTKATFGLDREFLNIIKSLDRQGVGKPLRSMELAGQEVDPRKHYTHDLLSSGNKVLRWTAIIAGTPGIAIEDFTRTIGIRAFYTLGKKAGLKGDALQDFISVNVAKSYGPASGRLAKPPGYYIAGEGRMKPVKNLAQSTIESWLTFKNFAFMNYGQWGKIWRSLRSDNIYRSAAYKVGSQIALGGLKYVMWSATFLSLMTLIYDWFDIPEDPEEQYEELFKHFNKFIPGMGDALYRGVASVTFKIDLSNLFAQTAPIEEPFNKDVINMLGGAPVSAVRDIQSGRYPRFLRGYQVTEKYKKEGVKLGSRELTPPKDITETDITKRKLGYTPLKIAEAYQEENSRQFKSGQYTEIIRDKVSDTIIPLIESGEGNKARDEFRKIWEDMKKDDVLTEHQLKSIDGLNSFISQVVLGRLKEEDRVIIKDWKNGYSNSRTRKNNREEDRRREDER